MRNEKLIDAIALFDKDIFANSPSQLRLIIDAARENEQLRKERDELADIDRNDFNILSKYLNLSDRFSECEHGFSPAKKCPNDDCECKQASLAYEKITKETKEQK